MNLKLVDQIAKAVLYEGYMLYPYRRSSVKNRQRFNFGVLYPPAYSEAQGGSESSSMRIECLVYGKTDTSLAVRLRFLHLQTRVSQESTWESNASLSGCWQEAAEREVEIPAFAIEELCWQTVVSKFGFPSQTEVDPPQDCGNAIAQHQEMIEGTIELAAQKVREDVFKVRICVRNTTPHESSIPSRDEALMRALVSTHVILGVKGGEFVSLLEPPGDLHRLASQCQNVGAWPVLVGDSGQRDTMLASPIILYDYPQIAPESAGDLFDGTEIDEILSLRIMTLTEEEKREVRQSDERARKILERTEAMPAEQFMKLHGALRGMRSVKSPQPEEDIA